MQIQISWLLQQPTDLDLHCLQRQGISRFSRTRVKWHWIDQTSVYIWITQNSTYKYPLQTLFYILDKCGIFSPQTIKVNVLKVWTLYSIPLWLKLCFLCSSLLNTGWNGKQCRPWSDCSFRSSQIRVYTVCICQFVRLFSVRNPRTFTIMVYYDWNSFKTRHEVFQNRIKLIKI